MKELQVTFQDFKVKAYAEFKKLKNQREEEKTKVNYLNSLLSQYQKENELNESNIKETESMFRSKADNIKQLVKANEILKIEIENNRNEIEYLRHQISSLSEKERKLQNIALENDYINEKLEELGLNLYSNIGNTNSNNAIANNSHLNSQINNSNVLDVSNSGNMFGLFGASSNSNNFNCDNFNNSNNFNSSMKMKSNSKNNNHTNSNINTNNNDIENKAFTSKITSSPINSKKDYFCLSKSTNNFNNTNTSNINNNYNKNNNLVHHTNNNNYNSSNKNNNNNISDNNNNSSNCNIYTKNKTNNTSNGFKNAKKQQNNNYNYSRLEKASSTIKDLDDNDFEIFENRIEMINTNCNNNSADIVNAFDKNFTITEDAHITKTESNYMTQTNNNNNVFGNKPGLVLNKKMIQKNLQGGMLNKKTNSNEQNSNLNSIMNNYSNKLVNSSKRTNKDII